MPGTCNYALLVKLSSSSTSLYIGNEWAARELKPTHCISALPPKGWDATHLIEFDDKEGNENERDIKRAKNCILKGCKHLAAAMNTKHRGKANVKSKVLVHCWMGRNRSAAIIAAYAIKHLRWSFKKTITYLRRCVKKQRNFTGILQNKKFQAILKELH
jgi:protein-tyrosine phosphatase